MTSKRCTSSGSNKQPQAFLWNGVHNIWSVHGEPTSSCIILVMTSSQLLGNLKIIIYWQQLSICSFELDETLEGKTMPHSLKYTHTDSWEMNMQMCRALNTCSSNLELGWIPLGFFLYWFIYFSYSLSWNLCRSIRYYLLLPVKIFFIYIFHRDASFETDNLFFI